MVGRGEWMKGGRVGGWMRDGWMGDWMDGVDGWGGWMDGWIGGWVGEWREG